MAKTKMEGKRTLKNVLYTRMRKAASETKAGQRRIKKYRLALGTFVDNFSRVEMVMHICLAHHSRLDHMRAKALLSGVKADVACGHLRRLADINAIRADEWALLLPVIEQFGHINKARNSILHYGATNIAEGRGVASNARMALTIDRVQAYPVSPEILDAMTTDLRKIYFHIVLRHLGRPALIAQHVEIESYVLAPWQYNPPKTENRSRPPASGKSSPERPPKSRK